MVERKAGRAKKKVEEKAVYMRNDARRKLRSTAGESIAETLIAVLISALALVILAGAISATARIIIDSDNAMGRYYDMDANLATHSDASSTLNVTISRTDSEGNLTPIDFYSGVDYYENNAFANRTVVAY